MDMNLSLRLNSIALSPPPPRPTVGAPVTVVEELAPNMACPDLPCMFNAEVTDVRLLDGIRRYSAFGRRARGRRRRPNESRTLGTRLPTPPYPWAKDLRAKVFSLEELARQGTITVFGNVKCKYCDRSSRLFFNVLEKFDWIKSYIANKHTEMNERAPARWMDPTLPRCESCGKENCLKPIVPERNSKIDWLFLFLGEMLGCCSLEQLKYFCKHTNNHRTGAKNRLLYLTYLDMCLQLEPNGPFHRRTIHMSDL